MSDLQIVTGLSILISGFAQLWCGLSTYYWVVIVELAWFSSLTHLSCLTLLRQHLCSRGPERELRLFAMGLIVVLLVVGLGFTGNYSWMLNLADHEHVPNINSYAACYLRVPPGNSEAFLSSIVSMLLIALPFVSRIVKLHRMLSVNFLGMAGAYLSFQACRPLRVVFNWYGKSSHRSLKRTLCYYPIFVVFLGLKLILDFWSSMLLEVRCHTPSSALKLISNQGGWLCVAFALGLFHLTHTILMPAQLNHSGNNSSN
ncbi:unnamed protein product [Penicillium salamii]|nr:unnamed protein product [Penicillium salamii]CAG8295761.1 unnamed protein product [Penicillium salamii]